MKNTIMMWISGKKYASNKEEQTTTNSDEVETVMDKLTEHQFHTVWTTAAYMDGYNKRFFQDLYEALQREHLIKKNER